MGRVHDVIVIGAGPGGTATACYLAQAGLDVRLIDKFDFPRDKTCGDALTPRALKVLADLGVLERLAEVGYRVNGVRIFAPKGHSVEVSFSHLTRAYPYTLTVPRRVLDCLLLERAVASGAQFQGGLRVNELTVEPGGIVANGLRQGKAEQVRGRVAVIATGANLRLPARLGLLRKKAKVALAARAYYEDLPGLSDQLQMWLQAVPQAGYGWVFPLSATSANVGAGVFPVARFGRGSSVRSAQAVFESFVQTPLLKTNLAQARRQGVVRGYPIRTDFGATRPSGERVLLVGEAAGLVNPLTGDGIDFALESGKLAAAYLLAHFETADFSAAALKNYDQLLQQHYQALFDLCRRLGYLYFDQRLLNWTVSLSAGRADLKMWLVDKLLFYSGIT